MNRIFGEHEEIEEIGERLRRETSSWLTWALRSRAPLPRIPLRRESEGGFAGLMATRGGRLWARHWWHEALEAVDLEAGE